MKYALITGAKSLLAHSVIHSIKDDYFFFLVDIDPSLIEAYKDLPNFDVIIRDITKENAVDTIFESISKKTDRLDLVIHMAGIVELGSLTIL